MELAQTGEFVGLAGLGACGVAGGNDGQAGEKGIEHRGYRVCDELFDAAALADEFAEDAELAVGRYLSDNAGGCQTEVEAEVDGTTSVESKWRGGGVDRVVVDAVVDGFAVKHAAVLAAAVYAYPLGVGALGEAHPVLVAEGLVLHVFGCGVGFVGKDSALGVEHGQECAGLTEEDPAVGFDFFGLTVPPVVVVRRVGVENHAGPGDFGVAFGGVASGARQGGLHNAPGDLSGFVDPYAGQLQGQQLAHVFGFVEGQEVDVQVELGAVVELGAQASFDGGAVGNGADFFGNPFFPGVDGGGLEFGVGVADNGPAGFAYTVFVGGLASRAGEDFDAASDGFAGADGAHDAAYVCVALVELRQGRLGFVDDVHGKTFCIWESAGGNFFLGETFLKKSFPRTPFKKL